MLPNNSKPFYNNQFFSSTSLDASGYMAQYRIEVDITDKELYLFEKNKLIKLYPVAVGKPSTPTPVGTYTIINTQTNPGGPFGVMWFGLSIPHYGIHGNNDPSSIGKAVSHGCIRMYNKDVLDLSKYVGVGTVVKIYS